MARPKRGQEKKAKSGLAFRVTDELREALVSLAEKNGRSLTEEATAGLEAHVGWGKKGKQ